MRPPTTQRTAARLREWPCSRCRSGTPQTCTPLAQRRKLAPRSRARRQPAAAAVPPRSLPTAPPAAHPELYTGSGDPNGRFLQISSLLHVRSRQASLVSTVVAPHKGARRESLTTFAPEIKNYSILSFKSSPVCNICYVSHWSLLYKVVPRDEAITVRDDIIELHEPLQDDCFILLLTLLEWSCKSSASIHLNGPRRKGLHSHYTNTQIGIRAS